MYLDKIVESKNQDSRFLADRKRDWEQRLSETKSDQRSFVGSLKASADSEPSIIAEMKRASPSKGSFDFKSSVSEQVGHYERGGARAVSVLTSERFFLGTLEDLQQARQGTRLPILRKDFLTESWEIPQAKCFGADAILLIAAILTDSQLEQMIEKAHSCGLEVLLEIHDSEELQRFLHLNTAPDAVGINNRNLQTFEVTLDTTAELVSSLPKEICRVSESGFATRSDLMRFDGVVDAFLIGESLMRSHQPEQTLRGWVKG